MMLRLRLVLLATIVAFASAPAFGETVVTSHHSPIDKQKAQTCTTITQQDLNRTGQRNVSEVVRNLPPSYLDQPACKPPKPPPVNHTVPQYQSGTATTDSVTTDAPEPAGPGIQIPKVTFKPMSTEGGPNAPQLAPAQQPPDLVPLIKHTDEPYEKEPTTKPETTTAEVEPETSEPNISPVEIMTYDAEWVIWDFGNALQSCDAAKIKEFVPWLEEHLNKARSLAKAAHMAGDGEASQADFLVEVYENALKEARNAKPCPPENSGEEPEAVSAVEHQTAPELQRSNELAILDNWTKGPADLRYDQTPFEQFEFEVDEEFIKLRRALNKCDITSAKKLLPTLQEMLKRADQFAESAKQAGKLSNVDPGDAAGLEWELLNAIADANGLATCPLHHGIVETNQTSRNSGEVPKATSAVGPNPQQQRILDRTNAIRARFGLGSLRWNDGLTVGAAEHAEHMAELRELVHASKVGRGDVRENILRIHAGASPDEMMDVFESELRDLIPGIAIFPNVAIDGVWENVAHLTQIIWSDTTDMGCAWVERDGWIYLVCRYSPGGNKDGKPVGLMSASNKEGGVYKRRDRYCSKQEQIDDLLVLQKELIETHEWTGFGHMYGDAIRAEIERVKQAKPIPCSPPAT